MSKNIYSDSGIASSSSINTQSITTSELTISGASQGQILIVGDNNGDIDGLNLGTTNDVLVSNPNSNNLPGWSNSLNINTLTCNHLQINGVQTGDLIVGQTSNYFQRLPIGSSGTLLTSNGTNVLWNPITFPDPLSLNDLNVTLSLKLGFATSGSLFLDGNNKVYSLQNSYLQDNNTITMTGSSIVTCSTFNFNCAGSHTYLISVNFLANPNNNSTLFQLNIANTVVKQIINIADTSITLSYIFTAPAIGVYTAQLLGGLVNTNSSTASTFTWSSIALA